jgi:hypothetical protein
MTRNASARFRWPMKDLAERHGKRPHDIVEILAGA